MTRAGLRLPVYGEVAPAGDAQADAPRKRRVQLVCMPFQNITLSSLSTALLATVLRERGIDTTESYLHFDFARIFGEKRYNTLAESGTREGLAAELFFAEGLQGPEADPKMDERLRQTFGSFEERQAMRDEFERICLPQIEAAGADLIGFSTSFNQLFSSLWLSRLIKERWPHVRIVLGGSACAEPMGSRIADAYAMVDHVVSGYGEEPLVELATGGPASRQRVILSEKQVSLDSLPIPDYDAFVAQARGFSDDPSRLILAFESSRGCWYGEKVHCTFCGLNRLEMAYNAKSSERVLREIRSLWERYHTDLFATDSILARSHLKEVIPLLAGYDSRPILFYEVKSNMSFREVQMLRSANVAWIQPGIESLSTPLLNLLKKGVKAIQNLALLKWCREVGIFVSWNILCGIPGEDAGAYREQIRIADRYPHLCPPNGVGPVRVDRYAPYFKEYQSFGWTAIKPIEDYRLLHPGMSDEALQDVAYHFDSVGGGVRIDDYIDEMNDAVGRWRDAHARGDGLFWDDRTGLVKMENGEASVISGGQALADVIAASHDITTMANLLKIDGVDAPLIEELIDVGILFREGNHVVNLAARSGLRQVTQRERIGGDAAWPLSG